MFFAALPFIVLGVWLFITRDYSTNEPLQAESLTVDAFTNQPGLLAMMAALVAVYLWTWWPTFGSLWQIWMRSDEYSCGLLVFPLAIYAGFNRKRGLRSTPVRPFLWGLLFLGITHVFRCVFGLYYGFGSIDRMSIVVGFIFLVMTTAGLRFTWKVWPLLIYLYLMLPLPNRVHAMIAGPLQHYSTISAVFVLETLGYGAVRQGNVIQIGDTTVAVAEACNGLRMLTAFFVISGLVVLIVNRPWWQKLVILLTTIPISFLCNTIRLAITAIAFTMINTQGWEKVFHDFGGYAMMPLALAMVVLELWFMKKLVVTDEDNKPREQIIHFNAKNN